MTDATDTPTLTLSIVNTDNRELLGGCLATIAATVRETSYEVIVVDNASSDGSAEMLQREWPAVRVIRLAHRDGYGRCHNRAIAVARGQYVLILNEDMEMRPGAVDTLLERARSIPRLGAIGCRILHGDGSLQHSCFRFPTLASELFEALVPYTLALPASRLRSKMYDWAHDAPRDVDIVLGCCMLLPRAVLERVNAFDPAFFVYSEEHDLCRRLREEGLRVCFTPDAEMVHFGGRTSQRMSLRMALVQLDSRARYFRKHHGPLQAWLFRRILQLGSVLRALGWQLHAWRHGPSAQAEAKRLEYRESLKFIAAWKA